MRALLSYLPSNNLDEPTTFDQPADLSPGEADLALDSLIPDSANQPYDIKKVVETIVDDFLEVQPLYAQNIVVGFGRVEGRPVGVVANQPINLAGTLDIAASEKAARFVQMCDAFHIPLVTFLDVPGFLPGIGQEHNGIIRHGAKLLYAYCTATVPRIQVIVRKAYGGAYIVLDSRSIGADLSFAWPANEIAVMGAEGAARVVFRRQIAAAEDPDARREELVAQYRSELMHPYYAAERGLVDDVIDPADTRSVLISSLRMLRDKHRETPARKHGNPPQ